MHPRLTALGTHAGGVHAVDAMGNRMAQQPAQTNHAAAVRETRFHLIPSSHFHFV